MIYTLKKSNALSFADDTKLFKAITAALCQCFLQEDLNQVVEWSTANNMLLHENKFEVMNYTLNRSRLLRELPFTAELLQYTTPSGDIIESTDVVRDLGVYLSTDCSFTKHVNIVVCDARRIASWILGTFRDRSSLTMTTLFNSLVRSKLEYCCPVWNPYKIKDIQALEKVQREFTRRISGCKDMDYWQRLRRLKLLSLQRRRERYIIIHVWKIISGLAPNSTKIIFYTNERLGRRAQIAPFNHKSQRSISSALDSSFGIIGPKLWNILPKTVNSQTSLPTFKVTLGSFLDQFPDMPPVTGYTPPNNNSLLNWSSKGGHGVCA